MERSGGRMVTLNQHNSASAISYPGEIDLTDGQQCCGRSSNRTDLENSKCTDVTNRRSHVGLSTPIIYTNHRYNYKSLSPIFTDVIMHNY